MLTLATIRDFRVNVTAALRQVQRGGRVLVTRNAKPIAMLTPVPEDENLEDLLLASHPYFLKRYQKARESRGMTLPQLKQNLHAQVPGRGKGSGRKADRKT